METSLIPIYRVYRLYDIVYMSLRSKDVVIAGWRNEETRDLVGLCGAADIQAQLNVVSKKKVIYQKIAAEMNELGYLHMWEQCKTKIKNMIQKYKKVKCGVNITD